MLRVSEPKPVTALSVVELGQQARVFIQGADAPITGKVVFISPTIASTGQFNVEVEFDNPPVPNAAGYRYQFRPGMRARIELVVP